jgi:hypothetical protein
MTDTRTDTERYTAVIDRIRAMVLTLNQALGLDPTDWKSGIRVSFGYIGNVEVGRDDRLWSVFLPHPGRVGTAADAIGAFRTGDLDGACSTLVQLVAFTKGVTWQRPTV